jgi:hypothetical protein
MAEADIKINKTVILRLTEAEARWLSNIGSHQYMGVSEPLSEVGRRGIFDALREALSKLETSG